jgi:DNA polymerase-3 subunit delta
MKYAELVPRIEKEQYDPVYLFVGEEEFLKEESIRLLTKKLVDPNTKEFNFDLLYGGETDGATVADIAASYPMMAERRLVIFRDIHQCSPKDRKILLGYAANPTQSTCLILVGPKVDLRKGFYKDLSQRTATVVFWPLYDNQIPAWIRKYAQEKGVTFRSKALMTLQNIVGSNLQELANEIDKLVIYCAERQVIEQEDVEKVVGVRKTNSVFDLADAIAGKKLSPSLQILNGLLESGESEVGIVWMLTRHFTTLSKIYQLRTDGSGGDAIARKTRIRPHLINQYLQQVDRLSDRQLEEVFHLLLEADANLKSSYQSPRLIMELLVHNLCRLGD